MIPKCDVESCEAIMPPVYPEPELQKGARNYALEWNSKTSLVCTVTTIFVSIFIGLSGWKYMERNRLTRKENSTVVVPGNIHEKQAMLAEMITQEYGKRSSINSPTRNLKTKCDKPKETFKILAKRDLIPLEQTNNPKRLEQTALCCFDPQTDCIY